MGVREEACRVRGREGRGEVGRVGAGDTGMTCFVFVLGDCGGGDGGGGGGGDGGGGNSSGSNGCSDGFGVVVLCHSCCFRYCHFLQQPLLFDCY